MELFSSPGKLPKLAVYLRLLRRLFCSSDPYTSPKGGWQPAAASRPVILNGIEDIVQRPDLADRSLFLTLDPIPKRKRRPERELMAEFEAARPKIAWHPARRHGTRK